MCAYSSVLSPRLSELLASVTVRSTSREGRYTRHSGILQLQNEDHECMKAISFSLVQLVDQGTHPEQNVPLACCTTNPTCPYPKHATLHSKIYNPMGVSLRTRVQDHQPLIRDLRPESRPSSRTTRSPQITGHSTCTNDY